VLSLAVPLVFSGTVLGQKTEHELREAYKKWRSEFPEKANQVSDEEGFKDFAFNDALIEFLNQEDGDAEYAHNQFSAMSREAFSSRLSSYPMKPASSEHTYRVSLSSGELPESVDWRDEGAVTDVRDQSSCGSCWAFSAVESLESHHFLKNKEQAGLTEPPILSVQQVLECDPHDDACYGGFPERAFQYIKEAGGIVAETDYPYTPTHVICLKNQTFNLTCPIVDDPPCTFWCETHCKFDSQKQKHFLSPLSDKFDPEKVARLEGWDKIEQSEEEMMKYLVEKGPISIAINADPLQFYSKGVHNPPDWLCNPSQLNHAVLLVGFGTDTVKPIFGKEKQIPYWLVRNSWGEKWGMKGYFKLFRGSGKCGVDQLPIAPVPVAAKPKREAGEFLSIFQ